MGEKEDYLTSYRVFFENFAATVNPEDQLPVNIIGYTITESELPGEVLYWTTQYLSEKQCPQALMTPLRRIILDEVQVASKKTPNEFGYKSDESVYIALRLMQAVTARVNDVCLRYLDNARLDTLPPPPPLAQRDLKTVSCATKNSRRAMEDRHVEIGNLEALFGIETTEPTSFYAVYDGHAGPAAATYCAAHLHQYLVESPHFTTDLRRAMRDAYLKTDAEFIRKSNQERACGGSTAVTVAVRGRRLLAAWAGDSLALLAKRMRLMQLVRPHKPDRQDERDRIESSGGTVMYWGTWRVNGQLAVSRAIGDAQYKPYVTARPEIATVDLDGDEDFVVVACDGLWDFVIEDDVALAVYRQIAADPDDLKAVTKRLIVQAKRQGSADNISVIVVFLKDPRDIAADNCPPMDLGLDNAMMNAPPFTIDTEPCKLQVDAAAAVADTESSECAEAEADAEVGDNGVDNSDSDSEDLGPETAVDADDIDAESRHPEPQPPTPPAHAVEEGHVDGALVDNVAESGEDSEDEWNYFKGEGEREELNPSEEPDEPPRSETPCQDNSAWENSSVDMNSSPLNPDAPVFIPGSVAGADVLLAESPRKPVPMDDIELPDVAQFETEAVVRPAELLDLDNCDQLNGHHNISLDEAVKEHLNGNDKCNMDSLGFGFNVGIEPEKVKDTGLIQDFERIQKDTTDFCNIQVFQTHQETNPFAVEANDELFERLKNKERDPMSMSFYQEKDDDTCERNLKNESNVDLNAVQLLPDSDDEDIQPNGVHDDDKENISPEHRDLFESERDSQEPNNDIIMFDDRSSGLAQNIGNFDQDNFVDYNVTSSNNIDSYSNIEFESSNITQETVLQTDTPESHKLLFEQIPEIPDGKSSELGFNNDDELLDPSESEKDVRPFTPQDETSQDIEMESKQDSPCVETVPQLSMDPTKDGDEEIESHHLIECDQIVSPLPADVEQQSASPAPFLVEEVEVVASMVDENVKETDVAPVCELNENIEVEAVLETPSIKLDTEYLTTEDPNAYEDDLISESPLPSKDDLIGESPLPSKSPLFAESLVAGESPVPTESPFPSESPLPTETHLPADDVLPRDSPLPAELSLPSESPFLEDLVEQVHESASPMPKASPLPSEQNLPAEHEISDQVLLPAESPVPAQDTLSPVPRESELLGESPIPIKSPLPTDESQPRQSPLPTESPLLIDGSLPRQSPAPTESPLPINASLTAQSPIPRESPLPTELQMLSESPLPTEFQISKSPAPTEFQISNSPAPTEFQTSKSPVPTEFQISESPVPTEFQISKSPAPTDFQISKSPIPTESAVTSASPLPVVTEPAEKDTNASDPSVYLEPQLNSPAPPAISPLPVDVPLPRESPLPADEPVISSLSDLVLHTELAESEPEVPTAAPRSPTPAEPLRADTATPECASPSPAGDAAMRLTPDVSAERAPSPAGAAAPAPDLLPEEPVQQSRVELVTDVDIGIPESRAQEICVPVTNEIQLEEVVQPPVATTPPPTPAVEVSAPQTAPLTETQIEGDATRGVDVAIAVAAGAAAAGVAAGAVAGVARAKIASVNKKSPTTPSAKTDARTPKSTPRTTTAARTPSGIAAKKPASTALTPRTPTAAKTLTPATKAPSATRTTPAARTPTAAKPSTPVARSSAPAPKTTAAAKPSAPTRAPATARPQPTKLNGVAPKPIREASATARSAPTSARAAPAARTAPKPSAPAAAKPSAPAAAKPLAARPAPRPAPALAKPQPKPAERKPLTNGDVKDAKIPARPPVRAATATRPAPRAPPRAPAAAPAPITKPSVPKPLPRAPLDKQSKDLANKRITAKAAPPRTAPSKTAALAVKKAVAKRNAHSAPLEPALNGLANGDALLSKPPPSPPAADNALLPDVIA